MRIHCFEVNPKSWTKTFGVHFKTPSYSIIKLVVSLYKILKMLSYLFFSVDDDEALGVGRDAAAA